MVDLYNLKGKYQIAWGIKRWILVQLSQKLNILRFDKYLHFAPEDFAFCMETNQKCGK
jgi:hypothetical protein